MPFRFNCSNCQQRLSVSSRRRGQEVKCPRCRRVVQVPETEQAAAEELLSTSGTTSGPTSGPVEAFPQVTPHSELVYADADPAEDATRPDPRSKVTIPRYVVYTQGFLLGAIALAFFVFGLIVGSRSHDQAEAGARPSPATVTGAVRYSGQRDGAVPDAGSVIVLLPASKRPDEKAVTAGLRPEDPDPQDDHPGLAMLHSLGGDYTRADRRGHYQVRAPAAGRYFLLVISKQRQRSENDYPEPGDLARLGRYFLPATELLGKQRYQWKELLLRNDAQVNVTF